MDAKKRIVRFAPSPTGHLHIGGARTALFNYLFTKKEGGKFILRIEDTDRNRSTSKMSEEIIEGLGWLGLESDEPPYFQSDHFETYIEIAKKLLHENKAYRCFCSQDDIEVRKIKDGKVQFYKYDRFCFNLSQQEIEEKLNNNISFVIRFIIPEGETKFKDRIHKEVRIDNNEIEDFVLSRSDGTPTYHLSVVTDDITMNITDVIRGDDHISNTFKQILLFLALGKKPPRYSHLPLILGGDKKKLSKRHGETSILEFRKKGYLPEAMITYLSHLSWSPDDHKKIYNLKELIDDFRFSAISKNSPIFDYNKLLFLNSRAIMGEKSENIISILFKDSRLRERYFKTGSEKLSQLIDLVKPRMKTISDFTDQFDTYLSEDLKYDYDEFNKLAENPGLIGLFEEFSGWINDISEFNEENIEKKLRSFAEQRDLEAADIIHPLRFALTNSTVSPSIFEIIGFLGKTIVLERINGFIRFLGSDVFSD